MKNSTFEKLAENHGIYFEAQYETSNGLETAETVITLAGTKITRYTGDDYSYVFVKGRDFAKEALRKPQKAKHKR